MAFPPEKDSRWEAFARSDPDYFGQLADRITFQSEVPDEVASRFELVGKLMTYSYYEYDFQDAAMDRALLTFELALETRYEELVGEPPHEDMDLHDLIGWSAKQNLFEDEKRAVHATRKLRNMVAHPEMNAVRGPTAPSVIFRVVELINGLYADRELRTERKRIREEWNNHLSELTAEGAILAGDGEETALFQAHVLAYDNRGGDDRYFLLFWPLFELPEEGDEEYSIPEPSVRVARDVNQEGAGFHLVLKNEEEFILTPVSEEERQKHVQRRQERLDDLPSVAALIGRYTELRRRDIRHKILQP